jgi:hypothetical protein
MVTGFDGPTFVANNVFILRMQHAKRFLAKIKEKERWRVIR